MTLTAAAAAVAVAAGNGGGVACLLACLLAALFPLPSFSSFVLGAHSHKTSTQPYPYWTQFIKHTTQKTSLNSTALCSPWPLRQNLNVNFTCGWSPCLPPSSPSLRKKITSAAGSPPVIFSSRGSFRSASLLPRPTHFGRRLRAAFDWILPQSSAHARASLAIYLRSGGALLAVGSLWDGRSRFPNFVIHTEGNFLTHWFGWLVTWRPTRPRRRRRRGARFNSVDLAGQMLKKFHCVLTCRGWNCLQNVLVFRSDLINILRHFFRHFDLSRVKILWYFDRMSSEKWKEKEKRRRESISYKPRSWGQSHDSFFWRIITALNLTCLRLVRWGVWRWRPSCVRRAARGRFCPACRPFSAAATNYCDDREWEGTQEDSRWSGKSGSFALKMSCGLRQKITPFSHSTLTKKSVKFWPAPVPAFQFPPWIKIPCLLLPPSSKPPLPCPCQKPCLSIYLS